MPAISDIIQIKDFADRRVIMDGHGILNWQEAEHKDLHRTLLIEIELVEVDEFQITTHSRRKWTIEQ